MRRYGLLLLVVLWAGFVWSQSETTDLNALEEEYVNPLLKYQILSPAVTEFQVRQYLINQIAAPPQIPATSQAWTSEAARLRHHLLNDVAFHGWPREWVESAPKFEEASVIETGGGYRIRKLRYEIVPGFDSTALLYEPEHQSGKISTDVVSDRLARGEQVLALDVVFTGNSWKDNQPFEYAQMLDVIGDRTIGLEAAQLIGATRWAQKRSGVAKVRLEVGGIRTQGIALVAAALEPELFSEIVVRNGMHSLSYLLNLPVQFQQASELFCLDLYREFDIDSLEALAAPAKVRVTHYLELSQK